MGFWGKALGIGFGFMLGGPLGAVLGGFLGHMYDVESDREKAGLGVRCPRCGRHVSPLAEGRCPACGYEFVSGTYGRTDPIMERQFLFYVSLTSLAAKMAKADGVVTEEEVRAFDRFVREDLGLSLEERKVVAEIFNRAKQSPEDPMNFARQFRELVGNQPELFQSMVHLLFRIAMADGQFHPAEERFIRQVANILNMSESEYDQIRSLFIQTDHRAYHILGVSSDASVDEIKRAYKRLVQQYHPDRLISKGLPEDFIKIANEKMAEINQAYDQIRREKGF